MSKRQKTLFETWNKCSQKNTPFDQNASKKRDTNIFASSCSSSDFNVFQPAVSCKESQLDDNGFDREAGKTWIYPTNYPIRDYQFSIVQEALFKNTLVILPTGLGKTFIAAVVMYNIYRWYPKGKVVFMAPTRPLVAQQIDACYKVTGIPREDTTQMTGTNVPEERKRMWTRKRVFFLTPQVLVNDLFRDICPASSIKCVVVDEAHKALGNQAYCQVIQQLLSYNEQFRVLALTATPGSDTQAVKMVISNLLISHVEMRTEESEDVKEFTHIRNIQKIIVPLGDRLTSIKSRFLDVINVYLKRLNQRRAIGSKNPASLSKFQVLKMREDFSQHPPDNMNKFSYGLTMADFSLCISLYHAHELLLLHGARPFYNFLLGIVNGEKSIPHARAELLKNFDFKELMEEVEKNYVPESAQGNQNSKASSITKDVLPGHPKLEKLLEVVLMHFNNVTRESVKSTRVMIFSQYRDSVEEIVEMLNSHHPMIKAMSFIGQATKSATNAGFSQKHQLKVLQEFRSGGYNTLVSTCVGEEGLDIGEVDLIVCYDCPKSPIRLVQRMGRTGRLRKGSIIILIAEGKEEQMLNSCESKQRSIHKAISKGFSFAQLYSNSPSLIPPGLKPLCLRTAVTVETQRVEKVKSKRKCEESAFLSADELIEFDNCFKVQRSESPLLANSNIVSLDTLNQKNQQESPLPRLSLSNWVLWQSTPHRTHKVSHSSKSFLLIDIVDKINFSSPRSISIHREKIPHTAIVQPANNSSIPIIDLCDEAFNFCPIPDEESNFVNQDSMDLDGYQLLSSHRLSKSEVSTSIFPKNIPIPSNDELKGDTLLKRLFGITFLNLPKVPKECILEAPPCMESLMSVVNCSSIQIESFETKKCESNSKLHILNNKMKARLKRKSKELGINLSFSFSTMVKHGTYQDSIMEYSTLKSEINSTSFDVSFLPPNEHNDKIFEHKSDIDPLPNSITFDIDFDIPVAFDVPENKSDVSVSNLTRNVDTKHDNPDSTLRHSEINELGGDTSMILDQFLSNSDDVSGNLDSSFVLPLTIKKVVFENHSKSPLQNLTNKGTSQNGKSSKERNTMRNSNIASTNLSSLKTATTIQMLRNTEPENVQSPKPTPWRIAKMHEMKENESGPTQCTMTQLLSLISSPKQIENATSQQASPKGTPEKSAGKNVSSEDEIEPTPPKEEVPRFCYRINSLKSDLDLIRNDGFQEAELKAESCPDDFNQAIYFDLSEIQFSSGDLQEEPAKFTSKVVTPLKNKVVTPLKNKVVTPLKNKFDSDHDVIPEIKVCSEDAAENSLISHSTSFEKVFFDVSFDFPDLENIPLKESTISEDTTNAFTGNIVHGIVMSSKGVPQKESSMSKDTMNVFPKKIVSDVITSSKTNQITNEVTGVLISKSSLPVINLKQHSSNANLATKVPFQNLSLIQNSNDCRSRMNGYSNICFEMPNSEEQFMSQKSNLKKCNRVSTRNSETPLDSRKNERCEFDLSDFSISLESSESLLEQKQSDETRNGLFTVPKSTAGHQALIDSRKNDRCEFDLSDFSISHESSESLLKPKQSNKTQNGLLRVPKLTVGQRDFDDFELPERKNRKVEATVRRKEKKSKKTKNRNGFLLTQVLVSGSDSSDADSVSCDEDQDALEASFIDDDTLCESPQDQHCMYLQSVKTTAGLPQRFKLKHSENDNLVSSLLQDEGCSKYLLDSFCVDDENVLYTSSSDDVIDKPITPEAKANRKKRKRIITVNSGSSDEEIFIKKVKPTIHKSPQELKILDSQEKPKPFRKCPSNRVIISSDEDDDIHIISLLPERNCNANLSRKMNLDEKYSEPSVASGVTEKQMHSNYNSPKSNNKTNLKSVNVSDEKAETADIFFDLGWDNFSPGIDLEVCDPQRAIQTNTSAPQSNITGIRSVNSKSSVTAVEKLVAATTTQPPNLQSTANRTSTTIISPIGRHTLNSRTPTSNLGNSKGSITFCNAVNETGDTSVNASSSKSSCGSGSVILVDSRELASGKPVLSALRNKHGVNPVVMQLTAADYIISNKIAVERVFDSEFSGSGLPAKIVEKVKAMSERYEKSFVIIETDSRKRVLSFNKLSTKYLQFAVYLNVTCSVRVLYSKSFDETSNILYSMIQKETTKGFHIRVPTLLNPSSQKLFEFYQSLPHVSTICALNFVYHFPAVHMIFKLSVEQLKTAGSISTRKAQAILEYLSSELLFNTFS